MKNNLVDSTCINTRVKWNLHKYVLRIASLLGVKQHRVDLTFANRRLRFVIPSPYVEEAFNNLEHIVVDCDYYIIPYTRPNRGDRILDAGAFLGFYTVTSWLLAEPSGRVYSVEPNKLVLPFLRYNIELNKVRGGTIIPFAICPSSGVKRLFIGDYSAVSSLIREHVEQHSAVVSELEVKCVRLSSILKYLGYTEILKLDIEGLELEVLREALGELWRVKSIVVEAHTDIVDVREVEAVLEKTGFTKMFILASSEMPYQAVIHATHSSPR
ncbi:MAG: FkbM family methyltransferase [Desulfurococcaceae archaeon]|mgnify:CR=1 FL=1